MQLQVMEDSGFLTGLWDRPQKRYSVCLFSACSFLGALLIGLACGYFVFSNGQSETASMLCSSEDTFDLEAELTNGLDLLGEMFPEDAAKIHEHRGEIISHIVSIRDPAEDSVLGRFTLTAAADELAPSSEVVRRRLLPGQCTRAVAYFLSDLVTFLAGFAMFPVHEKKALVESMQSFIEASYSALQLHRLRDQISTFVEAKGARKKAMVILRLLKSCISAGGGFVKFFFRWVSRTMKNPWKGFSRIVQTSAKLALWRDRIAFGAFPIVFQVLTAERMVGSARRAALTCKKKE